MKKIFILVAIVTVASLSSCGSTWEISGNNVEISVCPTDTLVKKGTLIITPDTQVNVKRVR